MLALYRSGRQADALAAFQRARDRLVEELGVDPGAELRELEAQVLTQDSQLAAPRPPLPELPATLAEVGPTFVGRAEELAWLQAGLERAATGRGVLRLVEGPAGAGKTRLAAELARLAQNRHLPVRYAAGPAVPPALVAEQDGEAGWARVAVLVLDDLHAVESLPLDAIQRLVDTGPSLLVVATYDSEAVSLLLRAALDQLVLAGAAERRSLGVLAAEDAAEIVRRYAADADHNEVRGLADSLTDATPGQIHQAASAWAIQRATSRVDTAAAQLPAPQRAAQGAREDLVAGVLELQHARTQRTAEEPAQAHRLPVCPYKGLAAYGPDDAAYFVGRERLVAETLARLVGAELLAVVGPSGSGKSSLVRAGLLPALAAGTLPGSQRWRQLVLTPGDRPADALDRVLVDLPSEGRTLLVVDQLEELFTLAVASQRQAFVDRLVEALRSPYADVVAVITLRSDYYGHCGDHPDLAKLVQATTVLVGAMGPEELGRAIEVPAELAGLEVEPGVTEAILADAGDQPGALPLVSTALLALWEHRDGRRLTLAGYAQTGGVRGAVAQLADRVYDGFDPHQQAIARAILLRLTEPGEGGDDVRRRAHRGELGHDEATTRVVSALVARRLLIADEDTVEVAHEALLREWPRLRGWLEEDREGRRLHRQLADAANQWAAHDRDPEQLYRGARLGAALDWARQHQVDLNENEQAFLDASRDAHDRQLRAARRTAQRLRTLTIGLAGVLVLALLAGTLALVQRGNARHQAVRADAGRLAALAGERVGRQSDLAMLLAVEAHRLEDSVTTRGALLTVVGQSPRLTALRQEFGNDIFFAALSPDGKTLATCHSDGTLRLWDLPTGKPRTSPIKAFEGPFGGGFSPDGRLLASGDLTGVTKFWEVATGRPVATKRAQRGPVSFGVYTPDGRQHITVGFDGTIRYWRMPSGTLSGGPVDAGIGPLRSIDITPDGRLLAVSSLGGKLAFVDAAARRLLGSPLQVAEGDVFSVAFSPDGRTLATTSAQGNVQLWNVATRSARGQPLSGHDGLVTSVRFSPDGSTLASADQSGRILLWDVRSQTRIGNPLVGHIGTTQVIGFTADGTGLVSSSNEEIATWRLDGATLGTRLDAHAGGGAVLAASSDGRVLATGGFTDGRVRLWDPAGRRPIGQPLPTGAPAVYDVALSPDGRLLAAAAGTQHATGPGRLLLWDIATRRQVAATTVAPTTAATLAFTPDGRTLVAGTAGGQILRWEVDGLRPQGQPRTVGSPDAWVTIALSPDGQTLAVTPTEIVELMDLTTGRTLGKLRGHINNLNGLAFNSDGTRLTSVGYDGRLILWDVAARRAIGDPLTSGGGNRWSVALSPDGRTAATTGEDGELTLWDLPTRQQLGRPLPGHHGQSGDAVFLGNANVLASLGDDGALILWNLDPAAVAAKACALAGRNLTHAEWAQHLGGPYRRTCPQWPEG